MEVKELKSQLSLGGEKNTYTREDVFLLLDQIDEPQDYGFVIRSVAKMIEKMDKYDTKTISCIVTEGKAKGKVVVRTFLTRDFNTIRNDQLFLKGEDKPLHLDFNQIESVILQLNNKIVVDHELLYQVMDEINNEE